MPILTNKISNGAMGGTEILRNRLEEYIVPEVLDKFSIFNGRLPEDYDFEADTKPKILWVHDLIGDPSLDHLKDDGWKKFDRIVFVSNWQMYQFMQFYRIPWERCVVIQNAIVPIETHQKPMDGTIRLIYFSTPQRGLNILYTVFDALSKKYDNIELDVYSSFKIYGWEQNDEPFKPLFDALDAHPKINNHGSVSNPEIREALKKADILAFPSIWDETSCMVLMESMSAGLCCVHPNLAALPETAANWTWMYHWDRRPNEHAQVLYAMLDSAIQQIHTEPMQNRLRNQKHYADLVYNWDLRAVHWANFLAGMADLNNIQLPEVIVNKK
jgi:UDP-glucose:(glucosyl)LPS alpha-1,2-glucosyltransferase